jgi:TPP-dependent pyruvate/acetoin dehydrogenase alpha subunit
VVTATSLDLYRWLVLARVLDRALCAENPNWFPIEGEEASVVGAYCDLRPTDIAAPHYRDPFIVYLMRGAEMWRLAAQVLRKGAGYNKGRSVPFNGPFELRHVPWVAGDLGTTLGTATGAALALQDVGTDDVCVCAFGDGTANRGDFHENVNLAACWKLPIVYLCQHNGWAISEPADIYLPAPIVDRAAGYGIPGVAVDGNDVESVRAAVAEAIERARRGDGPTLIEARTWRQRGHWGGDAATYRHGDPPEGVRDPLDVQAERLIARGEIDAETLDLIHTDAKIEVARAVARAKALPDAGLPELGLEEVFA